MAREHARSSIQSAPPDTARLAEANRVTGVSILVNVVLTVLQVLVGLAAHSQSLIADAMHTLSDIVSDGFVLYANRKGAEAADESHPYGHGRVETAASLALGGILSVTGIGILVGAVGVSVVDANPDPGVIIGRKLAVTLAGLAILLAAVYLWALEGSEGYHLHLGGGDGPGGGGPGDPPRAVTPGAATPASTQRS